MVEVYETFPVNSYEAESRRINNIGIFNHSGEVTEFEPKISGETNSVFAKLKQIENIK